MPISLPEPVTDPIINRNSLAVWMELERLRNLLSLGHATAPTAADDQTRGIAIGTVWIDETSDTSYQCLDNTPGAAVWEFLSASATIPAAGAAGTVIRSNGTNWVASTPTLPVAAGTAGKVLRSDGTNFVESVPTYPNTGTAGKIIRGDGTNYVESTPTFPNTGTVGKLIRGDGTNYVETTATFPTVATGSGTLLRADGTNWTATTSTYPDTNGVSTLLYASSANVMAALATANSGVLRTSATGVPSIDTAVATYTPTVTLVGGAGNTVPVYTVNEGRYFRLGPFVYVRGLLSGDGGAEGAGTGTLTIALPVAASATPTNRTIPCGRIVNSTTHNVMFAAVQAGTSTFTVQRLDTISTVTTCTGAEQSNTTRSISFEFFYEA